MKASVDQMMCGGVGICVKRCPEVFRFQEGSKKATVTLEEIPRSLWEVCRKAASECPNSPIVIVT